MGETLAKPITLVARAFGGHYHGGLRKLDDASGTGNAGSAMAYEDGCGRDGIRTFRKLVGARRAMGSKWGGGYTRERGLRLKISFRDHRKSEMTCRPPRPITATLHPNLTASVTHRGFHHLLPEKSSPVPFLYSHPCTMVSDMV